MSKLNVLVVGASIAGPATAYWLAKAGATVTVIERFPKLRPGGQSIDIRTAGVTVMRKMSGMEAAVRDKSTQIEGMAFVRDNGRPYGTIRATGNPDQQSLVSEFEIFRSDLAQILFDMTKDNENIKYVFGEQVASMQHSEKGAGPITVNFANGAAPSEYDLVVACDGATSRTRAIGLGCEVRDHIVPTNGWAAYWSIREDLLHGSKVGHACSFPGGRFIALGPDPCGANRVALMNWLPRDSRDSTLPFRDAVKQGDDALKRFVAQQYDGVGWKTKEALEGMTGTNDFYASEIVQVKIPSVYKGRFALVGDAGYAAGPTGTGTSLALAGAYILAGEINKHRGNLAAGLQGYEEKMRPLIKELQKIPSMVPTLMAPQTTWGIWVRNHVFAVVAWTRILEVLQKYFAGAFASIDEYKLPDYEWMA